jgi:hypothetical protein
MERRRKGKDVGGGGGGGCKERRKGKKDGSSFLYTVDLGLVSIKYKNLYYWTYITVTRK